MSMSSLRIDVVVEVPVRLALLGETFAIDESQLACHACAVPAKRLQRGETKGKHLQDCPSA